MSEKITIAILDYNRPEEAEKALLSLRKYANFDKHILYLDNGSDLPYSGIPYSYSYQSKGWIDTLIINWENMGCGAGMEQLYQAAQTDYVLLLQVDQYLRIEIEQEDMDGFVEMLASNEYQCVDLAGNQGHSKFSDRAHLMERDRYLQIPKDVNGQYGGPGPFNHLKYTEEFVGDYFKHFGYKIAHIQPTYFADAGKWSVRQLIDGTRTKHRTDTKELWFLNKPTQKNPVFPNLTNEEWELALTTGWPDGKIPEREKAHSFLYWT